MEHMFSNIPILFGFLAAMVHVISGPDHIAAVGPLAINTKFRPWLIGMSWGIGHLIGMLIIGILFFFFRELIPVEWISTNSERLVGIMLILIGFWGLYRMFISRKKEHHKHVHTHHDETGNSFVHSHGHDHIVETKHSHLHESPERQTYLAALGIGILHGLAGVSHFISLLPTIAFANSYDSAMYLFGFGAGTIMAMVLFSFLLGVIAEKSVKLKESFVFSTISGFTGISAIFVGSFWIWSTW